MVAKTDKTNETAETETVESPAPVATSAPETGAAEGAETEEGASTGVRARRAFMLKQFLPNNDWINVNVVAKGKGTKALVGRIYGIATGFEDKMNTLPDGSVASSIAIKGVFESEGYIDGEVGRATAVYFPMAYAEQIKAAFQSDETIKVVEVDCDIGIEATGKTIPYEWVVIAFREGKEMDALKRLKSGRSRSPAAPALAAPAAQKALTAA
jgi:hypothetical protein